MTTFRCPSDILITSWLFTAWWHTWRGNHLVPCVAEWVGSRTMHIGVSWSKVPLLSIWSVAVPLCRLLLPCPSRWHGSLPRHGLWWLTCELHCSALPWRLGVCVPAVKESTSFLCSLILRPNFLSVSPNVWARAVLARNLARDTIDQFVLFIPDLVLWINHKVLWCSVRTVSCGDAVRFQNSCKCLAQSFHIWHDNHTFVIASCVLYFLCFVLPRFLHDVLFDPIDGPGRVATLTEHFSNVFFLLSVILFRHNAVASLQ